VTKEYIEQLLADMGIERGCNSLSEYERGKVLIAVLNISESEYEYAMKTIADYCGV
jgi:hypothetical protein